MGLWQVKGRFMVTMTLLSGPKMFMLKLRWSRTSDARSSSILQRPTGRRGEARRTFIRGCWLLGISSSSLLTRKMAYFLPELNAVKVSQRLMFSITRTELYMRLELSQTSTAHQVLVGIRIGSRHHGRSHGLRRHHGLRHGHRLRHRLCHRLRRHHRLRHRLRHRLCRNNSNSRRHRFE